MQSEHVYLDQIKTFYEVLDLLDESDFFSFIKLGNFEGESSLHSLGIIGIFILVSEEDYLEKRIFKTFSLKQLLPLLWPLRQQAQLQQQKT